MNAHLVQFDIQWEDKQANFDLVRDLLATARPRISPGDLIVLPEMFDTGFSLRPEVTHDGDERTLSFLAATARDLGTYIHGGRTILGDDNMGRNMATIVNPRGEIVTEYAKIHPFSYGRESERFVGGDEVVTWDWPEAGLCVCPAVCYDLRFPELFRIGLQRGAEMFVLGANWPQVRQMPWRALLIARAIENQAYVIGVNRTGTDPHLKYGGGSICIGPAGDVFGELEDQISVLTVAIDAQNVRDWRQEFTAWKDMRLLNG